jgi:F-type H+-transporting ATPase subunit alpha
VRLEYAQFLELEMFTRFGGMSDTRVKGQLARGEAIRTLLTQPRFTPLRSGRSGGAAGGAGGGAL